MGLLEDRYPDLEVFFESPFEVAYLPPFIGAASDVEPVGFAAWATRSPSGVVSRAQVDSISLTETEADLVPRKPPE